MPIMPPLRLHQSKALHRRRLAPPQSITPIPKARHQHQNRPLRLPHEAERSGAGAATSARPRLRLAPAPSLVPALAPELVGLRLR